MHIRCWAYHYIDFTSHLFIYFYVTDSSIDLISIVVKFIQYLYKSASSVTNLGVWIHRRICYVLLPVTDA